MPGTGASVSLVTAERQRTFLEVVAVLQGRLAMLDSHTDPAPAPLPRSHRPLASLPGARCPRLGWNRLLGRRKDRRDGP